MSTALTTTVHDPHALTAAQRDALSTELFAVHGHIFAGVDAAGDIRIRRGRVGRSPWIIQCLGKYPSGRRLADSAHTGHQKGMGKPLALDCVRERLDHRLLTDELGKGLRTVLARQHPVRLAGDRFSHDPWRIGFRRTRLGLYLRFVGRRLLGSAEQGGLASGFKLGSGRRGLFFLAILRVVAKHVG